MVPRPHLRTGKSLTFDLSTSKHRWPSLLFRPLRSERTRPPQMAPQSKKGSSKSPKSRRKGRKGKAAAASETESVDLNNGDYNIRSPERTELLSQLQEVIGNTPVTPAFWACCQLADMNCLRDIANSSSRVVLPLRKPVSTIVMRCKLLGFYTESRWAL